MKASEELECGDLVVLTEDTEFEEDVSWYGSKGTVSYIPLWKWLTSR